VYDKNILEEAAKAFKAFHIPQAFIPLP
jgi:hypothetical protein